MGGVKGLGLSFAIDILAGLITGGNFGLGMKSQYSNMDEPSGTGHMMIAINVDAIMGRDGLGARMARFCSDVKHTPMQDGYPEALLPGERAHRQEQERRLRGIPLTSKLYQELLAIGAEYGVRTGQDLMAPGPEADGRPAE